MVGYFYDVLYTSFNILSDLLIVNSNINNVILLPCVIYMIYNTIMLHLYYIIKIFTAKFASSLSLP